MLIVEEDNFPKCEVIESYSNWIHKVVVDEVMSWICPSNSPKSNAGKWPLPKQNLNSYRPQEREDA